MTQKEKLMLATRMAARIKGVAESLRRDARDFDCKFPLSHAKTLDSIADEFLKAK